MSLFALFMVLIDVLDKKTQLLSVQIEHFALSLFLHREICSA